MNQKNLVDREIHEKEKKKSIVLFGEVVRIGKQLETVLATPQYVPPSTTPAPSSSDPSLKSAIQHLKEELNAERNERQKLDQQSARDVADIRAALTRADAGIEERVNFHFETLSRKIEAEKAENARRLNEQHGDVVTRDLKRESERTEELKHVYDQIAALENYLSQETRKTREAIQTISKETEIRCQSMAVELGKEITSRGNAQQQIEDELRNRFGDLNEATREVTADIQTELISLEEVIRVEIQARMNGNMKVQDRLETITEGLTKAIELSRQELRESIENIALRAKTTTRMQEEIFKNVEKHVQGLLHADASNHRLEIQDLTTQVRVLSDACQQEMSDRIEMGRQIAESLEQQQNTTKTAFEHIQKLMLGNHDELQTSIEQQKERSEEELNVLAESVQEMISLWAKDLQDQLLEFQSETGDAWRELLQRQSISETKVGECLNNVETSMTEAQVESQVTDCLAVVVDQVADRVYQDQAQDMERNFNNERLERRELKAFTQSNILSLKNVIKSSNTALAESDRRILELRAQDNDRMDKTAGEMLIALEKTQQSIAEIEVRVDSSLKQTNEFRNDLDKLDKAQKISDTAVEKWKGASEESIRAVVDSVHLVKSLLDDLQTEISTKMKDGNEALGIEVEKLQTRVTAQTTELELMAEKLTKTSGLTETIETALKTQQEERETSNSRTEELGNKLREVNEVLGHVADANELQRLEDQQKINKLSKDVAMKLEELTSELKSIKADLNTPIDKTDEAKL